MTHLLLKTGKVVNTHSETDKMWFGLKFLLIYFQDKSYREKAELFFNLKEFEAIN